MDRKTLIWIVLLVAGFVGAVASGVWLVVAGYQADLNPAGASFSAPWVSLLISIVVAIIAFAVLLAFADELRTRGAGLRVLNLGGGGVDTATPMGSMLFTVMDVDHGLTGANRARPGLREATAAVRKRKHARRHETRSPCPIASRCSGHRGRAHAQGRLIEPRR